VVNKIDRPAARPDWVVDSTYELFMDLGATDEQVGQVSKFKFQVESSCSCPCGLYIVHLFEMFLYVHCCLRSVSSRSSMPVV
jgi:hypothetical protein